MSKRIPLQGAMIYNLDQEKMENPSVEEIATYQAGLYREFLEKYPPPEEPEIKPLFHRSHIDKGTNTDTLIELVTEHLRMNNGYHYLEKLELVEALMVGVWNGVVTSMEGAPNKEDVIGRVKVRIKKKPDTSAYFGKRKSMP